MIIVTGRVVVKEGALQKLRPAMEAMISASRAEPGCIAYSYGPDLADPNVFLVLEKWESREALKAHLETPHLKSWRAALAGAGLVARDLVAGDAEMMETI